MINESIWWQFVFCFCTKYKAFQYVCKKLIASKLFFRSFKIQSKKTYKTLINMLSKMITIFFWWIDNIWQRWLMSERLIEWIKKEHLLISKVLNQNQQIFVVFIVDSLNEFQNIQNIFNLLIIFWKMFYVVCHNFVIFSKYHNVNE